MAADKKLKMAVIAGASHAMRYKEQNPQASASEVVRHIAREVNGILNQIDAE